MMLVRDYRRTSTGFEWWTWRRVIPPIPSRLLDCVFYVYPDEDAARRGDEFGGAGFMVSVPLLRTEFLYAVTNHHMLDDGRILRFNTRGGDVELLPTKPSDWRQHGDGDDLAVMPFGIKRENNHLQLSAVPARDFVTEQGIPLESGGYQVLSPGQDVFAVSRFVTHDGRQRNQPVVRFGQLAMMAGEPIEDNGISQVAFLVEMLSLSGASGSPVFVYGWGYGGGMAEPVSLLGIDFCHLRVWRQVVQTSNLDPITGLSVEQNSGMMGVIPAWKLFELLEEGELKEARDEETAEIRAKSRHVALDEARTPDRSEFEQFDDLARKLIHVPKDELDEKRKEERS
jgi:hypothetical protein